MRFMAKWGGPSGHLTWPLKKQKTKNKKNNKTQKNYPKKSFSVISQFFGGCPKFPLKKKLGKKARTQKTL